MDAAGADARAGGADGRGGPRAGRGRGRELTRADLLDLARSDRGLRGRLALATLRALGLLEGRRWSRLRVVPRGDGGYRRRGELAPAGTAPTRPPQPVGAPPPPPLAVPHPPLEWLEIDDVVVSGGALVRAGRRFLGGPDIAAALAVGGELKGPGIRAHADRTVLVDARRPGRRLPAGVPLTGFGAHNWYHWLVELLPRLQLLAGAPPEARTAPLIVPTSALGGPAGEALRLLAPDAELVGLGRDETLRLDRCWWIDSPVLGPRTFRAGWPATGAASAHHHATMAAHRAALRVAVGLSGDGAAPEGGPAERLLLVRGGDAAARWYRDVAERLGLRPVDPGGLTFVEQARTFARAEVVVGAWGAAWAGWLLAPRSARGLIWAPEAFRDWPLYANLTGVGGRELQHLFLPSASTAADFRPANRARPDPTPERLLEAFRLAGLDR